MAQQASQRGHEDIVHQRGHDLSKRRADNHADSKVQDTAAHGKFFELFEHKYSPYRNDKNRKFVPRADSLVWERLPLAPHYSGSKARIDGKSGWTQKCL